MNTIQMQATAHVLAAQILGKGDTQATLELIETMSQYADRPGVTATLQAVARLARRYAQMHGAASA